MREAKEFNRSEENIGNVLNMEHINLTVPDQQVAALFYVSGLGFTRDPYVDFGTRNMWINAGAQQFHLPKSTAQKWRGHIGVVVPDLDDLKRRLDSVARLLAGTEFDWEEKGDHIAVTCPWGNAIRAYAPEKFPGIYLGIAYAQVQVSLGVAEGIASFYEHVFRAPARVLEDNEGRRAEVSTGLDQRLIYKETTDEIPGYDGHHIAIYLADFSSPVRFPGRAWPGHGRDRRTPVSLPVHRGPGHGRHSRRASNTRFAACGTPCMDGTWSIAIQRSPFPTTLMGATAFYPG